MRGLPLSVILGLVGCGCGPVPNHRDAHDHGNLWLMSPSPHSQYWNTPLPYSYENDLGSGRSPIPEVEIETPEPMYYDSRFAEPLDPASLGGNVEYVPDMPVEVDTSSFGGGEMFESGGGI